LENPLFPYQKPLDASVNIVPSNPVSESKTAVVIGAGFGGIALAIRLQSAGIATTLLEKRDKPGGRAYVYEKDGFVFDGGPTVITDPSALQELWALSGHDMAEDVELLPVSPFYQLCWDDGYRFDYVNDQAELDRQIAAKSPQDVEGYRKFLAYSQDVYHEGYEKLGTVPFLNFSSMIKAAPQLMRLQSYRSVYSKVSSFIKDEQLRQAFSFHSLLVGGNPFETSSIYALIHALERSGGVWFAKGGTGSLVQGMIRHFQRLGGTVRLGTAVDSILTENGRATGVSLGQEVLKADMVASNGDVVHTYEHLLRNDPRGPAYAAKLRKKRHSMSLFVIYFGLKGLPQNMQHHMVLFGPRYRELIHEIFHKDGLADDFSLYLHCPSVTDDSLAPPGHSAFYVLSPVPHLGTADIDWDVEGPRYRDRILDHLEKHYIPGLRQNLVTSHILTPFGFRDELNAHLGSAFSIEPILTQSAWFRPHNRDDTIPNLYIAGAGTHPGAGVPGVVGSAKATAQLMLSDSGIQTAEK
jgi:phytoene desaturase